MLSLNNADGQAKRLMGRVLQLASFSLAEVTYTAGDIGYQVQESVKKATYTVQAKQENVSGVVLPAFEGVKSKDGSGTCPSACIGLPDGDD
jgi:V-type H+-transporting ATPase subunit D